jgi:signal transduction histidine kinase
MCAVLVQVTASSTEVGICVEDTGGGISYHQLDAATRYFATTAPKMMMNYTYSRQFGAAFDGLGFGLPMSHAYAELTGGGLRLASRHGEGCVVFVSLSKHGEHRS